MTRDQMQQFARFGAEARLQAISHERDAILRAFPDLGRASAQANASLDGAAPARFARKRRRMSAAQRKAVGARMKAYWAKRRAEKAGAKKTAPKAKRKGGMSAAARKAQAERMKAYWAAKRAQKVNGAGEGTQSETAGQNGAPSSKRGGDAGRKQGRKK
jgi:hypothetical protein